MAVAAALALAGRAAGAVATRGAFAAGAGRAAGAAAGAGAAFGVGQEFGKDIVQKLMDHSSSGQGNGRGQDFFTILNGLQLAQTIDSQLPSFSHVIMVSVNGGPKADLLRIWQLALSTAFGRYRQAGLMGIQGASLEGSWDITNKAVMVRLSYTNSGTIEALQNYAYYTGFNPARTNTTANFLLNGPTVETVGGDRLDWTEADAVVAAAVGTAAISYIGGRALKAFNDVTLRQTFGLSAAADTLESVAQGVGALASVQAAIRTSQYTAQERIKNPLPDTGRLITTGTKNDPNVQPPAPSADGLSRTTPFLALVANALTDPAYLPASPPQVKPRKRRPRKFPREVFENRVVLNQKVANYAASAPIAFKETAEGKAVDVEDGYPKAIPEVIVDLTGKPNTGVS